VLFPGVAAPLCLNEVMAAREKGISAPGQPDNGMEVV